jgi:hypothetical protein
VHSDWDQNKGEGPGRLRRRQKDIRRSLHKNRDKNAGKAY